MARRSATRRRTGRGGGPAGSGVDSGLGSGLGSRVGSRVGSTAGSVVAAARTRFARRRWLGRLGRWRAAVLVLTLAVVGAAGAWMVWMSGLLAVDRVQVDGVEGRWEQQVLAAVDVAAGTPLARVDLSDVERTVGELPAVGSVQAHRDWPGTLQVDVHERVPVAVLSERGTFRALDASGVIFRRYAEPPPDLPLVAADQLAGATRGGTAGTARADALREVASVVESLGGSVSGRVDHVEVASLDAIELVLRDGVRVRWGSAAESTLKADVLEALMRVPATTYDVSVPQLPTTSG